MCFLFFADSSFSVHAISRFFKHAILLPSHLCLDAPTVGLLWVAVLLPISKQASFPWPASLGLFTCIWAIYLFDRLYDARFLRREETNLPSRHQFTLRHRRLLILLLTLAVLLGAVCLPFLSRRVLIFALGLGMVTAVYYLRFRFLSRSMHPSVLPSKELTIACSFVIGIFACLFPIHSIVEGVLIALSLGLLFFGNCLKIASAESAHDREHDPAGFYTQRRGRWSETLLVSLPILAAFLSLPLFSNNPFIAIAILATALTSATVNHTKKLPVLYLPALADLALIVPPFLFILLRDLLSR